MIANISGDNAEKSISIKQTRDSISSSLALSFLKALS
jgi:hypothetical protein